MSSHTIGVKYIPSTSIDYFNTLLSGVEAPGGSSLFTLHVETFSCRVSRADKQHFENQRREHASNNNNNNNPTTSLGNTTYNGSTPSISCTNGGGGGGASVTPQHRFEDDDFKFDNEPPASSQSQQNSTFPATFSFEGFGGGSAPNVAAGSGGLAVGGNNTPPNTPPLSALSPQTVTASAVQSGRPCFPEYFVIPGCSSVTSMGAAQGSTSSGNGMGSPAFSDIANGNIRLQQQQLSGGNWFSVANNNGGGNSGTDNSTAAGGNNNNNSASSHNNNNNAAGGSGHPPTFRLPDGEFANNNNNTNTTTNTNSGNNSAPYVPTTPDEAYALARHVISERLVYLVGALNSLYGTSEYDFSVLGPDDFILVNPITFITEINAMISSLLPAEVIAYVGQNGEAFWRAIGSMLIGGEASLYDAATNVSECDVFLLHCPSCDPTAQTKQWASHYFVYHKKSRVIISVIGFGEAPSFALGAAGVGIGRGGGGLISAMGAGGRGGGLVGGEMLLRHTSSCGRDHAANTEEFYTDSYGNTHFIGGANDDDDDEPTAGGSGGVGSRKRGRRGSQAFDYNNPMSPTSPAAMSYGGDETDTPQFVQASMTDVAESEYGNDDAM